MKTIKNLSAILICFFSLSFTVKEKTWEPVSKEEVVSLLKKTNEWYSDNSRYSIQIEQQSFENYLTSKTEDDFKGYFLRDGKKYHSFLLGMHTIQNEDSRIVIDTANKVLFISNPSKQFQEPFDVTLVSQLLEYCQAFYKMHDDKDIRISFTMKGSEIQKCEFVLDGSNRIKKLIFYYQKSIKDTETNLNKIIKPRIETEFHDYNIQNRVKSSEFETSHYIINKNNKLLPASLYAGYKIKDLRIHQ